MNLTIQASMSVRACPKCDVAQPATTYKQVNGKPRGWCRACKNAYKRTKCRWMVSKAGEPLVCSHCKNERAAEQYAQDKGRPTGWCQPCRTAEARLSRRRSGVLERISTTVVADQKCCAQCQLFKPITGYSPSIRGRAGVSAYCRECTNRRNKTPERRERNRLAMASYRVEHRVEHLAAHRLRMFERRCRIEVTQDGTVTAPFLEQLYSTVNCSYCGAATELEDRTADHVVPLARGARRQQSRDGLRNLQ